MQSTRSRKRRTARAAKPAKRAAECRCDARRRVTLADPPVDAELLTRAEFEAAIAMREQAPHRDPALDRKVFAALPPLPTIPGLRLVVLRCPNGDPLPRDWAISIEPDETPIALAALPTPHVGVVSVVARAADLPLPRLDTAAKEQIASALVDALLAQEVRR